MRQDGRNSVDSGIYFRRMNYCMPFNYLLPILTNNNNQMLTNNNNNK